MNFPLPDIWGNNMLKNFGDIVMPKDVAWWPVQPGWWVLLGVLLLALGFYVHRRYRHWKRNAYRRLALKQLSSMNTLREMNTILKHAVVSAFPADSSADLWGANWIDYLNSKTSAPCFVEGDDARYNSLLIQPEATWPNDIQQLKGRTQAWLEQHKEAEL